MLGAPWGATSTTLGREREREETRLYCMCVETGGGGEPGELDTFKTRERTLECLLCRSNCVWQEEEPTLNMADTSNYAKKMGKNCRKSLLGDRMQKSSHLRPFPLPLFSSHFLWHGHNITAGRCIQGMQIRRRPFCPTRSPPRKSPFMHELGFCFHSPLFHAKNVFFLGGGALVENASLFS